VRSKNLILFTVSIIVLTSVVVYSADAAGIPKKAISTVARFLESDLPTTSVFTDQASTYTAGKQTFVASSSSSAGVNIPTGSDPTTPAQGDIWLNSDTLKYRGTSTHSLITSAVTSINSDTTAAQIIQGVSGNTSASTSAGTTTINTGSNVVVTGGSAQTISKQLTINSGVLGGNLNVGSNALSNSGHLITIPTNTGIVLLTNGSGSSLTNIVTSITGTANNLTSSASTGAVTLNLGSNVVMTGGSAQKFTKLVNFTNGVNIDGLGLNYVSKTGAYTPVATDDIIAADTSSSGFTVTLPSAITVGNGKAFVIENIGLSAANILQIKTTGGQTIDGATNINMTYSGQALGVFSDGSNWKIFKNLDTSYDGFYVKGSTTRWYGNSMNQGASGTILWTGATLRAFPWIISHTITIDKIETEVSTAANPTTTVCRMGIYRDNGNAYPQALVSGSDTGTFTTTAAVKSGTFGSPITLQEGLYWLAVGCDTAATTQPTFRGVPVTGVPPVLGYVSTMGASGAGTGYTSSGGTPGTTALPTQYPAGATVLANTVNPMVLVEIQKG
jgi:hypothetical protein